MATKGILHKQFMDASVKKKITYSAAESSALTIFFGLENSNNLISRKSLALYHQGMELVKKTLNEEISHVSKP